MLSDLLKTKHILFGINAKNKKHLFQELSAKSEQLNKLIDQKTLFEKIIMREKLEIQVFLMELQCHPLY